MGFVHRALYTWFVVLVFLILLCLRLETRNWSWFLIFTPLWLYSAVLLIYISIKILTKWRNVLFRVSTLKEIFVEYRWSVGAVMLMLAIQFNICLLLDNPHANYSIFLVMGPVWVLLTSCIIFVFYKLISS